VPVWQAPVAGLPALAGHINQLLGTHPASYLYAGTQQASSSGGSGGLPSNGLWLAQKFTTGSAQTAVGYATFSSTVTGSPAPWSISLQADSGGQPSGTALAAVTYPYQLAASTVTALLPAAVSPSTQYWLVTQPAGDSGDYFAWAKSSASSGCLTAPDGVTWSAQTFGLRYGVYDQSTVPPLVGIVEDSGARFTLLTWGASAGPATVQEYTVGQTVAGGAESARSLTYSNGLLTGVA